MSDTGDGLDHLRIPYDKIKFGRKLESQGYGTVFEGEFDNQRVALKQLNITNLANIKPKLLAEILTISKFRNHPNLVALLGFCDEKSNEITLVYEYVSSGNLEDTMRKRLTTIQRFEICLGAARGLCYLHTGIESITIVHGNIKLSKILLNSNSNSLRFEAKISSFGLSKIVPGKGEKVVEASEEDTEKVSEKSDVYSFGVMLLIVLCGVTELVDTDDYEEHHVSVVVPKKMKQNKLRNTVHRDIRKEIKTEALETYAAIACQCVMENPDERPDMVKVVEELEKALILQGGEVTSVQLPASEEDVKDLLTGEKVDEDGENNTVEPTTTESSNNDQVITKEILNSKTESNEEENESKFLSEDVDNEMSTIDTETTEDQTIEAFHSDKKSIISNENKEDDKSMGATSNGENNMIQDTNSENVLDTNHIEDAKNENNIDDPTTENEVLNDSNFTKESNVTVENQEETTSKIAIKDAHNEMSTIDREITEITTTSESSNGDTSNLNQESVADKNHTEEKKEYDKIMNVITTPESSNGDISTSTSQEVHKPNILKLQGGSFSENNEDELERLRIPFAEIKFGQKIDVRGYGTMYEGLYSNQQVALKRLNITNLHNIKPNLLSAILTIYKFRLHPNVVTLIGFCDESNKELVLVYEYVSGGNLADKMSKHLNTIQRHQICLGAARGLEYLHNGDESVDSNPCIIHGNLKLSKILLSYDSESSNFVAKLSGFGLPKLLPGHVEIGPKSMEKLTKESDVYSFGVLLLEVLCGVPELVDTDDYQERYVTELVPKRLEQNMLRKIVHFDIRDEITNESLETYAKIACRCVRETPEERPSMSEVVIELEKALRLQGGKESDVQCVDSSNENVLPEVPVGEDDHKGEDNVEATSITEIEPKEIEENIDDIKLVEKSLHVPISGSSDVQSLSEDVETKNGGNIHDPESTEEITINLKSNEEESNIIDNESNITTSSKSDNGDDSTPAMGEKVSDVQLLATNNGNSLNELPVGEDDLGNDETTRSNIKEEESKVMEETTDGIALDQKVSDGSSNGNDLVNASVGEDDQQCDDNGVTLSSTTTQEESKVIEDTIDDIALESVLDKKYIVDAKNESSNNDLVTQKEILNDLDLIKESNITVENEEDNKDADNEMSTTNPEVTKENIDDFDSKKESKIIEEYKEDDESAKISTTLNSSNGDTTTSTMEEVHESKSLKSDRGSFSDVNEDELERLRISFEEIKFGQKIDARGYGTMFEGEYNNQQVALKRLNITNLHNIKPKLLSAILTIYKFRQHPNLVALIGFCDESNKELILVYEYVSDGNLADKMSKHLNTIQRHQICLSAARGLEYLHSGDESANSNPCIIHGNLKLSKILLNYDSVSSNFVAKVSGFGLPKLLPGHVEIGPKSTEKLTKESDVYSFGVLLLEVLCGVPELVDTDDYQERHVTELVPKRLEQNMLRKIIHFDIRDEITAESLETYARIVCRCVRENPEERPTMTEVVIELEKALRLQGGKVSDVRIFGSYGNGQHEVAVGEDDHEGDGNGETMSSKISEEELKVVDETIYVNDKDIKLLEESFTVPVSGSDDVESVREEAETKNDDNLNDPERIEETTVDQTSMDDSKICVENEVSNVNMITTESSKSENDDDCSSAMEDAEKENVTVPESIEEITTGLNSNEESKIIGENEVNNEIKPTPSSSNNIMEVKNSAIPVGNGKAGSLNTEKPALIVNDRGSDYGNSIIQIQESESKRSNSTSSGSSNGDDTTPTDHLLPQSPDKVKKTRGSGNCYCCLCSCSWLQFISDRVVFYGELFWNKLVSFFTWMTGQCSSKRD